MRRSMTLSFPPVTPAVKWLLIIYAGVFLLQTFLAAAGTRGLRDDLTTYFALVPALVVMKAYLWQVFTYQFLHDGLFHLLFNGLALWMFGSQFELDWRSKRFLEYFWFCVIGAGVFTTLLTFVAQGALRLDPTVATVGASGGIYGLLLAFGYLYGDREIIMFPLPFMIKAKYMVAILIFVSIIGTLGGQSGVAHAAHLSGAIFGLIYLKFLPKRGLGFATSEGYYGLRNRYYKWKRRRAARKFEVYMRKHDRSQYFDEYGNYRDPGARDKDNGDSRGPWVN